MSKELFEQYQEEQIHTMVSMPYEYFKQFGVHKIFNDNVELIKHYVPSNREKFKKDKRWIELQKTINECREEQNDIEFELTNETRRSLTESK